MTLAELMKSPIGTTDLYEHQTAYERFDVKTYLVTHRERCLGEHIRQKTFYGDSRTNALLMALEYDRTIKEGLGQCENILAKQHGGTRQTSAKH